VCENEQKPELEPIKSESSGTGAGAMFMETRALELELCHFYDVSTALNFT